MIDKLPKFDDFFIIHFFPFLSKDGIEVSFEETINSRCKILLNLLKERGMFDNSNSNNGDNNNNKKKDDKQSNNDVSQDISQDSMKDFEIDLDVGKNLPVSYRNIFNKLYPKFIENLNEWKNLSSITTTLNCSSVKWIHSVEELCKILNPANNLLDDNHLLWKITSNLLDSFCISVEYARNHGNLGKKFIFFIQEIIKCNVLWNLITNYLKSLFSYSLHKITTIHKNGLCYFLSLLSSPQIHQIQVKEQNLLEFQIEIWNSIFQFYDDNIKITFIISYLHCILSLLTNKQNEEENLELSLFKNTKKQENPLNRDKSKTVFLYENVLKEFYFLNNRFLHFYYLSIYQNNNFYELNENSSFIYFGDSLQRKEIILNIKMSQNIQKHPIIQREFPCVFYSFQDWFSWEIQNLENENQISQKIFIPIHKNYKNSMEYQNYLHHQIFSNFYPKEFKENYIKMIIELFSILLHKKKKINFIYYNSIINELFNESINEFNKKTNEKDKKIFLLFLIEEILNKNQIKTIQNIENYLIQLFQVIIQSISSNFLFSNNFELKITQENINHIIEFFNKYTNQKSLLFNDLIYINYFFKGFLKLFEKNEKFSVFLLEKIPLHFSIGFLRFWNVLSSFHFKKNSFFITLDSIYCFIDLILLNPQKLEKDEKMFVFIKNIWLKYSKLCCFFLIDRAIKNIYSFHKIELNLAIHCILMFFEKLVLCDRSCSWLWKAFIYVCLDFLKNSFFYSSNSIRNDDFIFIKLLTRCILIQPCLLCLFHSSDELVNCPYKKQVHEDDKNEFLLFSNEDKMLSVIYQGIMGFISWQILKEIRFDMTEPCWKKKSKLLASNFIISLLVLFENIIILMSCFDDIDYLDILQSVVEPFKILSNNISSFADLITTISLQIISEIPAVLSISKLQQKLFGLKQHFHELNNKFDYQK